MASIKRMFIHIVLFFLCLFMTSMMIYSQEQQPEMNCQEQQPEMNCQEQQPEMNIQKRQLMKLFQEQQLMAYLQEHQLDLIVYQDTVILDSPFFPFILDVNRVIPKCELIQEYPLTEPLLPPLRFSRHNLFADVNNKKEIYQSSYKYILAHNIRQIKYTKADFSGEVEKAEELPSNIFKFLFKIDYDMDYEKVNKPERFQPKRRYWIYSGNHKIQLSQNYISQNWYKGGVKNFNLINLHSLTFNYKKNKIEINNLAEWKLNLYTNPNDTVRNYRIADDLIRTHSNIGIQAFKNWYYSTFLEIKTQLLKKFTENSTYAISSSFSPLYVNIGILGIRYQLEKLYPKEKGKKVNFNMEISPLSIEYITVLNKDIDPKRFGIKEGDWHLTNLGSTVNSKLVVNFNKNVKLDSRFYYFTNYEKITAEWETKLDMPINRYFSTSLYLFVRFDDNKNIVRNQTLGYFQINELLSFGFNYNW